MTVVEEPGTAVRLAASLRNAIGAERVLTNPAQQRTYECDGLAMFRVLPVGFQNSIVPILRRLRGRVVLVDEAAEDR